MVKLLENIQLLDIPFKRKEQLYHLATTTSNKV